MPRRCSICSHRDRKKIDAALANGESNRTISNQFRLTASSVQRHRQHVGASLQRAAERREESASESIYAEMRALIDEARGLLAEAKSGGDVRGAIAAVKTAGDLLNQLDAMVRRAENTIDREVVIKVVYEDPPRPPERPLASRRRALPPASEPEPAPVFVHRPGQPLEPVNLAPESPRIVKVEPPPLPRASVNRPIFDFTKPL